MRVLSKISDVVYSIEKVLALILALTLMVSMVGGFFFRYVFKNPLLWSDELAIFCLIWITFIGGSMVLKEKASPAITILVDAVPDKYKNISMPSATLFCSSLSLMSFIWRRIGS